MPQVFICADSLNPTGPLHHETGYSYGPGAVYNSPGPVEIDPAGTTSEGASLIPASNTRGVWFFNGAFYKMQNRQQGVVATVILKTTDLGASWTVLDSSNSPATQFCSGFVSGSTVLCAFNTSNIGSGFINLRNFDLTTETWGSVYGTSGNPATAGTNTFSVWLRPDNTLLVLHGSRNTLNPGDPSGIGGVSFDLGTLSWSAPFDVGFGITTLTGWDPTQTICLIDRTTSVMDSNGLVHVFFNTSSTQIAPVIWINRCFYQAINLDDSLGSFEDFPGQVAPLTAGQQDLACFSGSPLGQPVIVNDIIVLPVSATNRLAPPFPPKLPNVYLGTPVANPVWSIDSSKTIDPGALVDTLISQQEAPAAFFDGSTIYAVYSAQNGTGQNEARLRLCTTANLASPADGWFGITIFDLEFDSPPGFNFGPSQYVGQPSIVVPVSVIPILFPFRSGAAGAPKFCPSIKKQPKVDLAALQQAYEVNRPPNVEETAPCAAFLHDRMKRH